MNQQDPPATAYQRQTNYRPPAHTNERTQVQTKPWPERGSSQMGQHGSYSQASSPNNLYTQPPRPPLPQPSRPLAHIEKTENTSWRFKPTNNQGSQRPPVETSHSMFRSQSASGPPPQVRQQLQIQIILLSVFSKLYCKRNVEYLSVDCESLLADVNPRLCCYTLVSSKV